MDGELPGMTLHLNLLMEQAEEALRNDEKFRAQNAALASGTIAAEIMPKPPRFGRLGQFGSKKVSGA